MQSTTFGRLCITHRIDLRWTYSCPKKGVHYNDSKTSMINSTEYEYFSDEQIVQGILANDQGVIQYFFFEKCSSLFGYIINSIFDGRVDRDELVNEFFLFLQANDWHKVRQFDYRSKLITWVNVVAIRFFQRKRRILIEKESTENLIFENKHETNPAKSHDLKMDIERALKEMNNKRYKDAIIALDLKDIEPEEYAKSINTSVANLYNIRRRAHLQLGIIMKRKEEYYG